MSLEKNGLSLVNSKQIKDLKMKLEEKEKLLKRLDNKAKWARKNRKKLKDTMEELQNKSDDNAKSLQSFNRGKVGRPRLEEDQPAILSTILDIVQGSSAAHDRRRCEQLRCVKTLDDLVTGLKSFDIKISRTATYYRLLPR